MASVPPGYNPSASLLPDPGAAAAPIHTMMGGGGGYTTEQKEQIVKDLAVSEDDKDEFLRQLVDLNCSMDKNVILDARCNVVQKYLGKTIRSKINSSVNSTEVIELSAEEAKYFKGNSEGKVLTFQYEVSKKKLFADYKVGSTYYRIYGKTPDAIIAKFESEVRDKIVEPSPEVVDLSGNISGSDTSVDKVDLSGSELPTEEKQEDLSGSVSLEFSSSPSQKEVEVSSKADEIVKTVDEDDTKSVDEVKKPKGYGQLRVEAVLAAKKKAEEEKKATEQKKLGDDKDTKSVDEVKKEKKLDEEDTKSIEEVKKPKGPGQLRVEAVLAAKKKAEEEKKASEKLTRTNKQKTGGQGSKTRRAIKS